MATKYRFKYTVKYIHVFRRKCISIVKIKPLSATLAFGTERNNFLRFGKHKTSAVLLTRERVHLW